MPATRSRPIPPEVDAAALAAVAGHVGSEENVHGIVDTARLVTIDNIGEHAPPPDLSTLVTLNPLTSARNVIQPTGNVVGLTVRPFATQTQVTPTVEVGSIDTGGYARFDRRSRLRFKADSGELTGDGDIASVITVENLTPNPNRPGHTVTPAHAPGLLWAMDFGAENPSFPGISGAGKYMWLTGMDFEGYDFVPAYRKDIFGIGGGSLDVLRIKGVPHEPNVGINTPNPHGALHVEPRDVADRVYNGNAVPGGRSTNALWVNVPSDSTAWLARWAKANTPLGGIYNDGKMRLGSSSVPAYTLDVTGTVGADRLLLDSAESAAIGDTIHPQWYATSGGGSGAFATAGHAVLRLRGTVGSATGNLYVDFGQSPAPGLVLGTAAAAAVPNLYLFGASPADNTTPGNGVLVMKNVTNAPANAGATSRPVTGMFSYVQSSSWRFMEGAGSVVAVGNVGGSGGSGIGFSAFGSSTLDVHLYRSGADTLRTDDYFWIQRAASADSALAVLSTAAGANATYYMTAGGQQFWGSGAAAGDLRATRTAAGEMTWQGVNAATQTRQVIKMVAAQTTPPREVQDSASAVLESLSAAGSLSLPKAGANFTLGSSGTVANSVLEIHGYDNGGLTFNGHGGWRKYHQRFSLHGDLTRSQTGGSQAEGWRDLLQDGGVLLKYDQAGKGDRTISFQPTNWGVSDAAQIGMTNVAHPYGDLRFRTLYAWNPTALYKDMIFTKTGQLQVPEPGSTGGLLLGGDAPIFRDPNGVRIGAGKDLIIDSGAAGLRVLAPNTSYLSQSNFVGAEGWPRFKQTMGGDLRWGGGALDTDVSQSRTAAGQLTIQGVGAATATTQILKQVAAQAANVFETQTSAGSAQVRILSSGQIEAMTANIWAVASGVNTVGIGDFGSLPTLRLGVPGFHADLSRVATGQIQADLFKWKAANVQTTVGGPGGASPLPLTPYSYLKAVHPDGTVGVVPFYAAA